MSKLILIALLLPLSAPAADVTIWRSRSAQATFVKNGGDPCGSIWTFVYVVETEKTVYVDLSWFNTCTADESIDAHGTATLTNSKSLDVSPSLQSAHVEGDVTLEDRFTHKVYSVHVKTEWQGYGEALHYRDVYGPNPIPGGLAILRTRYFDRSARAVGTVSDDATEYANATDNRGLLQFEETGFVNTAKQEGFMSFPNRLNIEEVDKLLEMGVEESQDGGEINWALEGYLRRLAAPFSILAR